MNYILLASRTELAIHVSLRTKVVEENETYILCSVISPPKKTVV